MRITWDVQVVARGDTLVEEPPFIAMLSQVLDGREGAWPRLIAMDPTTLVTTATMWGARVCLTPGGATAEGVDDLDTHQRVRWLLRNPRPLLEPTTAAATHPDQWRLEI